MIDWPIFALILTPIVGIIILLLNRILGNEKLYHAQWKIVLFILAALTFQIAILGQDYWGVSSSGLFRLDGLNTHLSLAFVTFCLLSHISMRFDQCRFVEETGLLQLAFVMCGLIFILANSLLLYVFAAPIVFLIAGTAALYNQKISKRVGFRVAILSGMVAMFIFAFSAALIGQAADAIEFNRIQSVMATVSHDPQFALGWALHAMMCVSFLLLPPTTFFLSRYEESESWSLTAFFRMSLPLLGVLLLSKLIFLTGFSWSVGGAMTSAFTLSPQQLFGIFACGLYLLLSILLLTTDKALFFAQISLSAGLFGGLLSPVLTGEGGFLVTQSRVYIYIFSSALLFLSFTTMNISTKSTLQDLRDATQKAPISVQIGLLISLLSSVPLITFAGFDLSQLLIGNVSHLESADSLILIGLMGVVSVIISNRVVELYFGNAKRNSKWDERGLTIRIWSYALMVTLLILGIYPTPLYKYLSHSINLFVKNAY